MSALHSAPVALTLPIASGAEDNCKAAPRLRTTATGQVQRRGQLMQRRQGPGQVRRGEDGGKLAHYLLRWVNTKGETGPWGQVASATIPAV